MAAEALLAQTDGAAALLGAHIFTFHSATPATLDAAPGVWLRVARASAQSLAWALLAGLDDNSYGAPVATGTVQLGAPLGAASWLTLRLIVRGSGTAMRAAGSVAVGGSGATLLFNRPIPWAPQAGFFGLATGSFTPSEAVFRSLDVRAAATTCDAVPAEGAFVEVEMCQVGAPGQMFELWLPRTTVAADFSYKALVNYDAPDLDCGPKLAGAPDTWAAQCADNLTAALNGTAPPGATCACVAYNSNGYPKAAYSDLEVYAYGSVTLNVMQPPRGQLRLTANTSLCLSFGGGDDNNGALILARCDDDADSRLINASQLFAFSREAVDNSLAVSGPLLAVDARGPGLVPNGAPCVDVWDLSFDVDHAVRQGGWNKNVLRFSLSTATSNPLTLAPPPTWRQSHSNSTACTTEAQIKSSAFRGGGAPRASSARPTWTRASAHALLYETKLGQTWCDPPQVSLGAANAVRGGHIVLTTRSPAVTRNCTHSLSGLLNQPPSGYSGSLSSVPIG